MKLMKKTNIVNATSVPSESQFSISGYTDRKQRSRLSSKSLRFSMLAKQLPKLEELKNFIWNDFSPIIFHIYWEIKFI